MLSAVVLNTFSVFHIGIYAFCIDNSMSTFTSKLVSFYLLSYSNADWQAVAQELQEFNVGVENYTVNSYKSSPTKYFTCLDVLTNS